MLTRNRNHSMNASMNFTKAGEFECLYTYVIRCDNIRNVITSKRMNIKIMTPPPLIFVYSQCEFHIVFVEFQIHLFLDALIKCNQNHWKKVLILIGVTRPEILKYTMYIFH